MDEAEQLSAIRVGHLVMYMGRLLSNHKVVRKDETTAYLRLWAGMGCRSLLPAERNEYVDAVESGWDRTAREIGYRDQQTFKLREMLSLHRKDLVGKWDGLLLEFEIGPLTSTRVSTTLMACMFDDVDLPENFDQLPDTAVAVDGLGSHGFIFDRRRLDAHVEVVKEMLNSLSPENPRNDRSDREWGEQEHLESLMSLGVGCGLVEVSKAPPGVISLTFDWKLTF